LSLLLFLTSPYLQRQHFKFSTLLVFLVFASVSHISLPTVSTLQVLNTSSISCHCFCFPHLLTYSVNTSSSQHFSTLPAFLVNASVSHISLPTASTLQVLNTSSISCHCFCFPHLLGLGNQVGGHGHQKNICWHGDTLLYYATYCNTFSLRVPQVCFPRIFFKLQSHRHLFHSPSESWSLRPIIIRDRDVSLPYWHRIEVWPLLIYIYLGILSWLGLRCVHCSLLNQDWGVFTVLSWHRIEVCPLSSPDIGLRRVLPDIGSRCILSWPGLRCVLSWHRIEVLTSSILHFISQKQYPLHKPSNLSCWKLNYLGT
jgi:hypothetical protein